MAIVAQVDSPNDEQEGLPAASIHACHREALKVYLADGKLLIDLKGHGLTLNESTGLYELACNPEAVLGSDNFSPPLR